MVPRISMTRRDGYAEGLTTMIEHTSRAAVTPDASRPSETAEGLSMNDLLDAMIEADASDLHVKPGSPPGIRVLPVRRDAVDTDVVDDDEQDVLHRRRIEGGESENQERLGLDAHRGQNDSSSARNGSRRSV